MSSPIGFKAVVVEDDHDLQYLYRLKLEREGFQVATALNGVDGLKIVEKHAPDIVLLDLMMPVMGGAEMLEIMRSKPWGGRPRVIVLTNISRDEAPGALRFLHVDRYVVKAHHTPSQVMQIVAEVLGLNRRPREQGLA
jgi:two-component system alkaline phosphatase synthesis response regulator PhoP